MRSKILGSTLVVAGLLLGATALHPASAAVPAEGWLAGKVVAGNPLLLAKKGADDRPGDDRGGKGKGGKKGGKGRGGKDDGPNHTSLSVVPARA